MSRLEDIRERVESELNQSVNRIYPPHQVATVVVQRVDWERRLVEMLDLLDLVERAVPIVEAASVERYLPQKYTAQQWLRDVQGEDI